MARSLEEVAKELDEEKTTAQGIVMTNIYGMDAEQRVRLTVWEERTRRKIAELQEELKTAE